MRHLPACLGAAAVTFAACVALAQTAPPAGSPEMAGVAVYQKACAACHDGGDETAPELEQLQRMERERIATALKPGGVMAAHAAALSPEQHAQLVAFLGVPPERRAAMAIAARNRGGEMPGFDYPIRRVRHARDSATTAPRGQAWPAPKLGPGPFVSETWDQRNLKTVVVARGLDTPRAIEFLPGGDILIAERAGKLRTSGTASSTPTP